MLGTPILGPRLKDFSSQVDDVSVDGVFVDSISKISRSRQSAVWFLIHVGRCLPIRWGRKGCRPATWPASWRSGARERCRCRSIVLEVRMEETVKMDVITEAELKKMMFAM